MRSYLESKPTLDIARDWERESLSPLGFLQNQLLMSLTVGSLRVRGKWVCSSVPLPVWGETISQNHHYNFSTFVRKLRWFTADWADQEAKIYPYPERQNKLQWLQWESRNASCCWCCISSLANKIKLLATKSDTLIKVTSVMGCPI